MKPASLIAAWLAGAAILAAQEYTGRYLYAEPDASHAGGIRFTVHDASPAPVLAIAVGQRSRTPWQGTIEGRSVSFPHLPIDKYDLVIVTEKDVYEGVRLVPNADAGRTAGEREAIEAEVGKIEGFFDRKEIHRVEVDGELAGTFIQQWREGVALKQSGARVPGVIHSLDLIWFEKPLTGWQLVKRRQIYRQELALQEPLRHHFVETLSTIRVVSTVKALGTIQLPQVSREM